jgi:PrtD family type I secretion system ABC transporter
VLDISVLDRESLRGPARQAIGASFALNLLSLVTPLYFTQVYDRVLSSRSGATLIAVTLVTLVVIALSSAFDLLRNLVFARASATFYADLEARVFAACRRFAIIGGSGRRARPLDDLELVRSFLASSTPGALFDVFFVPLFIAILFFIHEALGAVTVGFVVLLAFLAFLNRRTMARTTDKSVEEFRRAGDLAEAHFRAIEPAIAMGFAARAESRSANANRAAIIAQMTAISTTAGITSVIKGVRQASQILIIALAAYLALMGSVSMGAIIASSILFSRSLSPIDQLVGSWRTLFQTRGAWARLTELMKRVPPPNSTMPLPAPKGALTTEEVVATAPGTQTVILKGITIELEAGESLGIVGPSGSGKSTLARILLGVWPASRGIVRLDGADMAQLDLDQIGRHIGYVPQNADLVPGTIAMNICRFGAEDAEGVVEAAIRAGAHEMILAQPQGYDTMIGGPGFALSGGQRQRVSLARALYGKPSLIILDEPDAGLDRDGELALNKTLEVLREEKVTVIVIAHRMSMVAKLDKILVLNGGRQLKFGKVSEILPHPVNSVPAAKGAK